MTSTRPRGGGGSSKNPQSSSSSIPPAKKKKGGGGVGGKQNHQDDDPNEEDSNLSKPGEPQVTKRTLQNRKAQREFRKRREARVKDLEERVKRYDEMGLEANLQLQRTARRLKDENEALRGLIVRLGHGSMIQSTLDGIGDSDHHNHHHDLGYSSQGPVGLTAPGAMDFGPMTRIGGDVKSTKSNASHSHQSKLKVSPSKKSSGKRKRGDAISEDEEDQDEEEMEEEEDEEELEMEEEIQPQPKRNSSSRRPLNVNTRDQIVKLERESPKSAPHQKSTFDQGSLYNSAKPNGAFNFNNDWYPGFNQQVQEEQIKQQQKHLIQRQDQESRQAKQASRPGPSRSPESSETLTSLSGSNPSSSSNTPVLDSETPQPTINRRQSDELLSLNLSNQRDGSGNASNNPQTNSTNPQNLYHQQLQSNPREGATNPPQSSQGGFSTSLGSLLSDFSRGGSGVSGSAMLGNSQSNGGFTAPTSQDRPSIVRAGNNGPPVSAGAGADNNGGSGNGGQFFPFIQPTHQNDALLNPNPIPFAFNLSNTSPPDQSWWDQMGGGMLTPGQDPNALDEKANAVAQALNGGNRDNNNNHSNDGGGSDNRGQRRDRDSQSPFDLSSFLTGGSSPGNNPFSISNFIGNGMDGNHRFTPTSPFGNLSASGGPASGGGLQRSSSRNSNCNPFESFGKFISSPSPSSTSSGPSPSNNPNSNSHQSGSNSSRNNGNNRSSSSSSLPQASSSNPFAQSEHAQTFLRLLERKIASMPGSDSPYTSLGFQPPSMHSRNVNSPASDRNGNQSQGQSNNASSSSIRLLRKNPGSSQGNAVGNGGANGNGNEENDSQQQKAALASTAASALEPDGVYSRLAKHPAFLSTNVQELEELVDAIGSNNASSAGNGPNAKSPSPNSNGGTASSSSPSSSSSRNDYRRSSSRDSESKDNVAHLFGMLDRKSSFTYNNNKNSSSSNKSNSDNNDNNDTNQNNGNSGGADSILNTGSLPSPNVVGRYAYGLTSPQLQHHHQLQQHLRMQQNRRS